MNEDEIQEFWQAYPCDDSQVGGLDEKFRGNYEEFFRHVDAVRYQQEGHIPGCLDAIDFKSKTVLEIGLGQGADSEQLIHRGAVWSGLDLTEEAVRRVRTRMKLRELPYDEIKIGSALKMPYPDNRFDMVFSHGVLHHIPDIEQAQREILRVLKPDGEVIIMLYAKWSLNYQVSIAIIRRLGLLILHLVGADPGGIYAQHLEAMRKMGVWRYLRMKRFIHRNTDGPHNPYSKVYDLRGVRKDYPDFTIVKSYKRFMHAPPLPVSFLPFQKWCGWHLWVHLKPRRIEDAAKSAGAGGKEQAGSRAERLITRGAKLLLDVTRPFLLHLPRGAGTIYRRLGGYRSSAAWSKYGYRTTRGIDHGYRMNLDLGNVFERETYYLGRFYEWELERVLDEYLLPGDTFIDAGANIGMVTLAGASRVGPQGRILAFEPNPKARTRLIEHVRVNDLNNIRIFETALGDGPGTATLTMATSHTGTGTLRTQGGGLNVYQVDVTPLDHFVAEVPADRRLCIKIDAEGYDFNVLKGAQQLLSRPNVTVFAEVNHAWLKELGQSAEEMFEYMRGFGFEAFLPTLSSLGLKRKLSIEPLELPGPGSWFNVLFLREPDVSSGLTLSGRESRPLFPGGS